MRWVRRIAWAVGVAAVALLLLAQVVPYGREHTNPPVRREPAWDSPAIRALAVRACFDCHSNETRWPLNFSEWDRPQEDAHESAKTVREGEMPPWFYVLPRPHARLSAAERDALIAGLEATFGRTERRERRDRRRD